MGDKPLRQHRFRTPALATTAPLMRGLKPELPLPALLDDEDLSRLLPR